MFNIRIADVVIGVDNRYAYVKRLCKDYIVEDCEPDFVVSCTRKDITAESRGFFFGKGYSESLCLYRALSLKMLAYDAFLMHSAVITMDGKAYAFAAASGTGKTTHTRLWRKAFGDRVQYVNGDKPIMRYINGTLFACGTPWQGKERYGNNIMVPLAGLCFVERGEKNEIRRITMSEAIRRVFHQVLMPKDAEAMEKHLSLVEHMLETIPCYLMRCNMEEEAAHIAHSAMTEGG